MIKLRILNFGIIAPQSKQAIRDKLELINIECDEDQEPLLCWIIAMHTENGLEYIPGRVHQDIMDEIISNQDARNFFHAIGGKIEWDEQHE